MKADIVDISPPNPIFGKIPVPQLWTKMLTGNVQKII